MKKIYMVCIVITLFISGCSQKEIDKVNISAEKENINRNNSPSERAVNYSAESVNEFLDWFNGSKAQTFKDGVFKNLIEKYDNIGYILCPSMEKEKAGRVFVDSNVDFINFVFLETGIRVVIEPLNTETNEGFESTDIKKFMEEKYDIKLDQKQKIENNYGDSSEAILDNPQTGYEYDVNKYTERSIQIGGEEIPCILEKRESEKSDTENILSFIMNEMLVKIIYFENDEKKFDYDSLKTLTFSKKEIN